MQHRYHGLAELNFGTVSVPLEVTAQATDLDYLAVRRLITNTIRRDYRPDAVILALRCTTDHEAIAHSQTLDLDPTTCVPLRAGPPVTALHHVINLLDEAMVELVTEPVRAYSNAQRNRLFTALEKAANLLEDIDTENATRVHANPVPPEESTGTDAG